MTDDPGARSTQASDYVMPPFPRLIGLVLKERSAELVIAEARVTSDHANLSGVLHGGAIMALADQCGGMAAGANLRPGQGTTTLESKTNFFAAVPIGDLLTFECKPLHRGRSTTVWQTVCTRSDGTRVAMIIQTQMTLDTGSAFSST